MRIVSQCGQADFPYGRTYILSDRENVKAVCDGKSYVIRRYSTHEKAIKAMEMCREKYADSEYNRIVLCGMGTQIGMMPDNIVEVLKDGICDNFTFRFPEDEEVDV